MTETVTTLPNPDTSTITDLGTNIPEIYAEMIYIDNNNTNEAILQNLRKKYV